MKILETRQLVDSPILMSWSPRMDLLALVLSEGQLAIYRLNWQRVWQINSFKEGIPNWISWHSDGHYICVVIKDTICIVEVENGRVTSKISIQDDVIWAKWCHTKYEIAMNSKPAGEIEIDRKQHPLESNLSLLLIGTKHGNVLAYSGGYVFILDFKIPSFHPLTILSGDSSDDVQCLEFLSQRSIEGRSTDFVFNHFQNGVLPVLMSSIGDLRFRFISLKTSWGNVQEKFQTFSDLWKKIYEVYDFYINFCETQETSKSLVQYLELVLTRDSSVELQMFLSSSGREKEVKKKAGIISTTLKTMCDAIPALKYGLSRCLYDLNSITQFIRRFGQVDTSRRKFLTQFEKYLNHLYYFVELVHLMLQLFCEQLQHFLLLVGYTIHSFNTSDYFTELHDNDKVIELLKYEVHENLFEFFLLNNAKFWGTSYTCVKPAEFHVAQIRKMLAALSGERKEAKPKVPTAEILQNAIGGAAALPRELTELRSSEGNESEAKAGGDLKKKTSKFSYRRRQRKHKKSIPPAGSQDYSLNSLSFILRNLSFISKQIDELQKRPLVHPSFVYAQYILLKMDDELAAKPISCNLSINSNTWKTNIFLQLSDRGMYLFEFDCSNNGNTVKSLCLVFSREILTSSFYSDQYLTLLSYEAKDDKRVGQEHGGDTIACQFSTTLAFSNVLKSRIGFCIIKEQNDYQVIPSPDLLEVKIPSEIDENIDHTKALIRHTLRIEDFSPSLFAVSGPRKVGSLMSSSRRKILLLDLDTEDGEDSDSDDSDSE